MMILGFSAMEVAVGVLIFTLSLLIFALAYKKLLAYMGKSAIKKENYCILYSLEIDPAKGEIQFYFTSETKKEVKIQLLDENYEFIKEIYSAICKAEGNIVPFNTTELPNGVYYYSLVTENQKTMKKMVIAN